MKKHRALIAICLVADSTDGPPDDQSRLAS